MLIYIMVINMKFLNEILNFFKNLTIENAIDLGIGLAIIVVFKIISSSLAYIIVKMFKLKVKDKNKIKNNGFYRPLKTFFVVLGIYIGFMVLKLPENIFSVITKIFRICAILLATKGFSNLFDSSSESFAKLREKINFNGNDTTINFFSKVAKALIYIIAGFILITELGYDLGGLATGLGISSVVIALAAQDIAKSFLAGISIISDKPFEIGDYITVEEFSGTVEDITFRTTRIRNADNQVIILPNSILTDNNIINSSKRDSRRFLLTLTLELDTPLEKVTELTQNIKLALTTHPQVINETVKVFFETISADGIDLSIDLKTSALEYVDYLKFKEEINYTLLDMVNQANIGLAYPSHSIYLKKD